MPLGRLRSSLPGLPSVGLAILSAILLILAFPDFEIWFLAWIGLVPLLWAIDREKRSAAAGFIVGWVFGASFFFGTCWWLAYAPIHYAAFPIAVAYFLVFIATLGAALFTGMFAAILTFLLKRFGRRAFLAAPFIWIFSEYARYWITGNNWNAIAYSQAPFTPFVMPAAIGGIYLAGFLVVAAQSIVLFEALPETPQTSTSFLGRRIGFLFFFLVLFIPLYQQMELSHRREVLQPPTESNVIAVQPNVPMSGITYYSSLLLRKRHVELTERALATLNEQRSATETPVTVIFPESPMNFAYEDDADFQRFVGDFASKHNLNVLFNSAEPDRENHKYFNSAVLVDTQGREIAQYDKIYLLPFGEAVPAPLESIVPAFVGSFSYGKNYNLIPLGDAKAGIMICFESHFGGLSREYVRRGADVIIEMTNDGYLGPTPVLRQHLANAVFRAVETNRPVLRVTNVGITAYIDGSGQMIEPTQSYTEDVRVWTVSKSDGAQTLYVKYGDWFAWLCTLVTLALVIAGLMRKSVTTPGSQINTIAEART
jgi:apolipoprotein N-acyltransferase